MERTAGGTEGRNKELCVGAHSAGKTSPLPET